MASFLISMANHLKSLNPIEVIYHGINNHDFLYQEK